MQILSRFPGLYVDACVSWTQVSQVRCVLLVPCIDCSPWWPESHPNQYSYGKSQPLIGKSTINGPFWAMFNSYVKLPEGMSHQIPIHQHKVTFNPIYNHGKQPIGHFPHYSRGNLSHSIPQPPDRQDGRLHPCEEIRAGTGSPAEAALEALSPQGATERTDSQKTWRYKVRTTGKTLGKWRFYCTIFSGTGSELTKRGHDQCCHDAEIWSPFEIYTII